jgi:hypothetical protein
MSRRVRRLGIAALALLVGLSLRPVIGGCAAGRACVARPCCKSTPSDQPQLRNRMPCCAPSAASPAREITVAQADPPALAAPPTQGATFRLAPPRQLVAQRAAPTPHGAPIYLRLRSLLL